MRTLRPGVGVFSMTLLDKRVLRQLLNRGTHSQAAIAEKLGTNKSNVASSLLRLRKAGFVELCAGKDGREKIPRLCILTSLASLERNVTELLASCLGSEIP